MFHAFALLFAHSTNQTPVRATLEDGQILMGEVQTRTLRLQSGVGLLEIPLADVGEVVPVSGGGLGESEGRVDVWLRNGSELRGTWADPKLAMTIAVGGDAVPIDLPMNDLSRFQLQGGTRWPGGPVYRMQTSFGDDFLVDPARTHLVLENDLGTFSPLLSECRSVTPVGDPTGPWRIQLQTGTVLLGHLVDDQITVALPIGPEEISVPLQEFVSLHVESWGPARAAAPPPPPPPMDRDYGAADNAYPMPSYEQPSYPSSGQPSSAEALVYTETVERTPASGRGRKPSAPAAGAPSRAADEVWFDNSALQATKDAQGQ